MSSAYPAPVEVLLATFNGEAYLREQIESIAAQDYGEVRILARDDGSMDRTAALLGEFATAYPDHLRVLPTGRPTGSAARNFAALLHAATGPYVAFADQDDVWLPQKLSRSMQAMRALEARHPAQTPLLVFTDLRVVDDQLQTVHESLWKHLAIDPESVNRPARLLGRSVVTGSTMLINRAMLNLARQMPLEAVMHDRWIGLLASLLGAADYLEEAMVLYRQHGANAIGAVAADTSAPGVARRVLQSSGRRFERQRSEDQAEALLGLHRDVLAPDKKSLLKHYLRSGRSSDPLTRLWLTVRHGFYRGSVSANLALMLDLAMQPTKTWH